METSKTFTDLIIWQKSHKLVLSIYAESKSFPKDEVFGLTSQIRRAAVSIPANIAEGFKRNGIKEKIRFYNIAQASLEEVKYFLILAKDLDYNKPNNLLNDVNEIGKMLESYANKLKLSLTK
jgi:four helix bundle protein